MRKLRIGQRVWVRLLNVKPARRYLFGLFSSPWDDDILEEWRIIEVWFGFIRAENNFGQTARFKPTDDPEIYCQLTSGEEQLALYRTKKAAHQDIKRDALIDQIKSKISGWHHPMIKLSDLKTIDRLIN